jgi:hypothetical protein
LVGPLAFAVVYAASGILVGIWGVKLHPVALHAGAASAIFGVYGLLLASLVLGVFQRSTLTVPVKVLRGLWPGVALFVAYNMLTEGIMSTAMEAGLVIGFIGGILIVGRVIADRPPARRVLAALTATTAIVVVLAAPLSGVADVSAEVARVKETEDRTARAYDSAIDRFKDGRMKAHELAELADSIGSELQTVQAKLISLDNVPAEHLPAVMKALEYLKLRQESWQLRAEGLRGGRPRTLQQADSVEHSALSALESAVAPFIP